MPWRTLRLEIVWSAISLLVACSFSAVMDWNPLVGFLPPLACVAVAGTVLLVRIGAVAIGKDRRAQVRRLGTFFAAVAVVGVLSPPLARLGRWTGETIHFRCDRARLERVVAEVLIDPSRGSGEDGGRYIVERGPPVRIAFVWSGFIDNWCGPVYDPTGVVMHSNEFRSGWSNWDDPKLASVKKLFGGDMNGCRKLDRLFYLCCFT